MARLAYMKPSARVKPMARAVLALSVLATLAAAPAGAQNFPSRPIHMVTAEPGGGTDVVARLLAPALGANLGQQVLVENKGGASGIIAAQAVMKSPPDGYTLLIYSATLWILPYLRESVPYDPVRDFSPVVAAASSPNILVVHPSVNAKTVRELIALAKAKPGEINYGSGGSGTTLHLSAELFKAMAGVNLLHVPFKSGGAALTALLGGQLQVMFPVAASAMPQVKSGKLRLLGVTSGQPSALVPDAPTLASAGLPGYASELIVAVFGPAGVPAPLVTRLNQEFGKVLAQPDMREKFLGAGVEARGGSVDDLVSIVKSDMAKWGKVIKEAGIRAD